MMNGISLPARFPYVEQSMVIASVKRPHSKAICEFPPSTLDFIKSATAFPERLRPIIATVGPIITGGINLSIQATPKIFTTIAMAM